MKTCHTTDGRVTLSDEEWDSLCDGCGLCCRVTKPVQPTKPAAMCPGYDCGKRQCGIYDTRKGKHACIQLEPDIILGLHKKGVLPSSCGYVSFMKCTPKLEPGEYAIRPFETLHRAEQASFKAAAADYQANMEARLDKYRSKSDPSL